MARSNSSNFQPSIGIKRPLRRASEHAVFDASAPPGAHRLPLEVRGFRACLLPGVSRNDEGRRPRRVPMARVLRLGGAKRPLDSAGQGERAARGGAELADDLRQYCPTAAMYAQWLLDTRDELPPIGHGDRRNKLRERRRALQARGTQPATR